MADGPRLILASGSPRRRELLDVLGVGYDVRPANLDEAAVGADLAPEAFVAAVATAKAEATAASDLPILAADTIVVGPDGAMGKPESPAQTAAWLKSMSRRSVRILSGVALRTGDQMHLRTIETTVHFRELTLDEIRSYAATGAGEDKAGALELQGAAAGFIEKVAGCWTNVVGLPLCCVAELLTTTRHGLIDARRCRTRKGSLCPRVAD